MASTQTDRLSVVSPVRVWTGPGTTCTLTTADSGVEVAGYTSAVTVVLPSSGGAFTIVDGGDAAQTYPITVKNSSGTTLGAIGTDGGSITFAWDGAQFVQINSLVNGAFGSGWAIDNAGEATFTGVINNGTYVTGSIASVVPTAGQSLTIPAVAWYLMIPAGTLATLTLTLPADAQEGQDLAITAAHAVTALTLNAGAGQTLYTSVTALDAGETVLLRLVNDVWFVFKGHNTGGGGFGTVTSVDASGGTTGLSFSGGPVTTSGTLTLSGVLVEANGGTGKSSYAAGDMLYASGGTTLAKLAAGTSSQVLIGGTAPAWGAVALGSAMVSGALGTGNGGTGLIGYTTGDLIYASGASTLAKLAAGTSSQVLIGGASAPSWGAVTLTALATQAAGTVLANVTGGSASPTAATPTAILDLIGATRGALLERGAAGWTAINPSSTSGQPWISQGTGADPAYGAINLAGGTLIVSGVLPTARGGLGFDASGSGASGNPVLYFSSTGTIAAGPALTGNSIMLGNSTGPKTVAGIITDGASSITLGGTTSANGHLVIKGSTSGQVDITVPTAVGSSWTLSLPSGAGTAGQAFLSGAGSQCTWGTLGVAAGGTNLTSYTAGDLIYASGTATLSKLAAGTSSQVLIGGTTPAWGALNYATMGTGNLPVANLGSGTGATSDTFWRGDGAWTQAGGWPKGITLLNPAANDEVTLLYTVASITIAELDAVLRGSSSPSVTWTIRYASDRSATGTEVVTGGTTTTTTTTAQVTTSFNSATIAAGNWVWLKVTAVSGTVNEAAVSVKAR